MSKYYPPSYESNQFHCSHCGVFAAQRWAYILHWDKSNNAQATRPISIGNAAVEISTCLPLFP